MAASTAARRFSPKRFENGSTEKRLRYVLDAGSTGGVIMFEKCPVCDFAQRLDDYDICHRCFFQSCYNDGLIDRLREDWNTGGDSCLHTALDNWIEANRKNIVEVARLRELQECLDHAYNPFEPDNQSEHYKRLKAALEESHPYH